MISDHSILTAEELGDDARGGVFRGLAAAGDVELRGFRRLVGAVDAGEVGQLARPRLGIEAFDIGAMREFG